MSQSPLFDIFGSDSDPVGIVPVGRKRRVEDLMSPEEQASMLQNLAYAGSSGLTGIGWLLDTPGAVVRGGLSGGLGKALSALWETSDERVTGRELARQYGLASDEDNWGNFGGGLAAEIALDPLTYLSFGLAPLLGGVAKTTAGKLAGRAGILAQDLGLAANRLGKAGKATLMRGSANDLLSVMPKAAADEARQRFTQLAGDQAETLLNAPMSAGNRINIPFLYNNAVDLYGKKAGDFIADAADRIGTAAAATPYLGQAVRSTQSLFDPSRMGFQTESGQWFGRELTQGAEFAGEQAGRRVSKAIVDAARGVGEDTFRSNEFATAFRNHVEGYDELIPDNLKGFFEAGQPGAVLGNEWRLMAADAIRNARARGIKLEHVKLPNNLGYLFRQANKVDAPQMAKNYDVPRDIGYDQAYDLLGLGTGSRGRRDYMSGLPSHVVDRMAMDKKLQDTLRSLPGDTETVRKTLDDWFSENAPEFMARLDGAGPYDYLKRNIPDDSLEELLDAENRINDQYMALADRMRRVPLQHAEKQIPFFGNAINDLQQYVRSRARGESAADVVLSRIGKEAVRTPAREVGGNVNFTMRDALEELGFDTNIRRKQVYSPAEMALAKAAGVEPMELAGMSVPKQIIQEMMTKVRRARTPREAQGLVRRYDDFLQSFKSLALLFPSRYTRDMYSCSFASSTQGAMDPLLRDQFRGAKIGRGSYDMIPRLVRDLPDYQSLNTPENLARLRTSAPQYGSLGDAELLDELMIRKFLSDAGGQSLTQASAVDDLGRLASNLSMREAAPGLSGPYLQGLRSKFRDARNPLELFRKGEDGKWQLSPRNLFWAQRTREGNPNWLLDLGDRAAQASDNFNRIGAYLNRIRKGDSPRAAKAIADLTQVNYRPEAFTEFEREFVKRLVPFYSYTKGITPLIADNLINRPAGLMGQSIRSINRAGEPSEDRFVPEYLRQSAAIPLGDEIPFLGLDTPGITRFLTNIDLPHEGVLNLFTPGLGNTLSGQIGNTITKTGQNLLGQMSPLVKGPLEYFTNRQFYSGRQLSDLFSMAEKYGVPGGRLVDQIVSNAPGGSRAMGIIRQLTDDRITMRERLAKLLFNTLTGLKLQDVDQDRTLRLAARSALNELLDQSKGMHTYENIFIKPEDLLKLSPQEQRQYLLYRVLQSQAARESRERKKRQSMMDPMQMLGAV